jgi:hypothetical protein
MRNNPIVNLIQLISPRDLRVCNRCGCPNLACVKYKSGKFGLVQTSTSRPYWQGDSQAPQGLWAVKNAFHNCAEYTAKQAAHNAELAKYQAAIDDKKMRSEWCHPKADNPEQILADAFVYLYTNNIDEFQAANSAIRMASNIMSDASERLRQK